MRRMFSENQLDSQIKSVIESGQVDNAKAIYCHPITMYRNEEGENYLISCMIFNQKDTEYTKEEFIALLKSFTGRLLCTGSYYSTGLGFVIATCVNVRQDGLWFIGFNTLGQYRNEGAINFETLVNNATSFVDAVNKIN